MQVPLRECCSILSGVCGPPYYCTPFVCGPNVIEVLTVWWHTNQKPKTNVCSVYLCCSIDPRVRKIKNKTSSCPGIFSRTLRFDYVASSRAPGSPPPLARITRLT